MGANPDDFAPAALRLVQAGFDVIDINFGCPVKKVFGRCRGGYLLGQVDTALEIVSPRARRRAAGNAGDGEDAARAGRYCRKAAKSSFTIFDGAFDRGVAAITVHGRTVAAAIRRPQPLGVFCAEVKQHAGSRTVLGSGDLFTPQACLDMLRTTGVDGVTVARGAIGNPWIFSKRGRWPPACRCPIRRVCTSSGVIIAEHYRLAEEVYGPEACGRQMRKFGIKYSRLHPDSLAVRDAFIAVKRPEGLKQVLDRFYNTDLPGRHPQVSTIDLLDCQIG